LPKQTVKVPDLIDLGFGIWDCGFIFQIPNPKFAFPNRITVAWAVADLHRVPLHHLSFKMERQHLAGNERGCVQSSLR